MNRETESRSGVLEEMTIEEVKELDPDTVVLGIGSTEPHGPHLPYGTDNYRANGVCQRAVTSANERGAAVLQYPTLPIGNNVNFKAWPFACRISVRTLMDVVLDIIEAIEEEGVRKIVLVNGHGGNTDTLRATLREHADRHEPGGGAFVALISANLTTEETEGVIEHPSAHAGESETSQILYLRPDLVRAEEFERFPVKQPTVSHIGGKRGAVEFVPRWDAYLPESAGGETRTSSAEKGEALIEGAADWLADFLLELSTVEVHDDFPYPDDD